jgi:O-antigen ligase
MIRVVLRVALALMAIVAIVILQGGWRGDVFGPALTALSIGVLALSVWRPHDALLVTLALIPIGTLLAVVSQGTGGGDVAVELLALACLAGASLRVAALGIERTTRLVMPTILMLAVVAASVASAVLVEQQTTAFAGDYVRRIGQLVGRRWFLQPGGPVHALALWIESLGLLLVASRVVTRADAGRWTRTLLLASAGASLMSLVRVTEVAWRDGAAWTATFARLAGLRVFTLYPDVNAGAAVLAVAFVATFWLGLRRRLIWLVPSVPLALALWLTGGRVEIAASLVVLAATAVAVGAGRRQPLARSVMAATVLIALVAVGAFTASPRFHRSRLVTALDERMEHKAVAFRIARDHPWFGVGLGEYRRASLERMPDSLRSLYPEGENAHDNFLQILAELGPLGLGAFVWLVAMTFRSIGARNANPPAEAAALGAGLVAFFLSCAFGHPLLMPQVSLWIAALLGVAYGMAREPIALSVSNPAEIRAVRIAVPAAVVALALSVPFRADLSGANLDGVAIGAAEWGQDAGGRYRVASTRSAWFIPGDATSVRLELRWASPNEPACGVGVFADGRLIDAVAPAAAWRSFSVAVPPARGRRFRPVELRASGAPSGGSCEPLLVRTVEGQTARIG